MKSEREGEEDFIIENSKLTALSQKQAQNNLNQQIRKCSISIPSAKSRRLIGEERFPLAASVPDPGVNRGSP